MTGLYIAMIIIAVIGLIILIPVTAVISFALNGSENEIIIRYLFFKLKLYPAEEKKKKSKKTDPEEKEPDGKKKDIKGYIRTVRVSWDEIMQGVSKLLQYVVKRAITVSELNISAEFGLENPMNTGLAAGAANAAVYNVIGLLDRHAKLKKWSVDLRPDFDEPRMEAGVYCRLRTRIAHIFPLLAILLTTFIKIRSRINK